MHEAMKLHRKPLKVSCNQLLDCNTFFVSKMNVVLTSSLSLLHMIEYKEYTQKDENSSDLTNMCMYVYVHL